MRRGIVSALDGLVTVELLGMARHRAGRAEVRAHGQSVAEVLRAVTSECPGLAGLLGERGELSRHYLVSLDGERFLHDLTEVVPPGHRLLILGADAGG
jgi:hypothetical protein